MWSVVSSMRIKVRISTKWFLPKRFSSVFAGTLPLEHLHRVWDLFLYEGRATTIPCALQTFI